MPTLGARFAVGAYQAGAFAAQHAPPIVASASASALGAVLGHSMRGRRSMVARHLRRADPTLCDGDLDRAVDRAFESYARYYVESFRLPSLSGAEINAGFYAEGYENIMDGVATGRGVILALPHLGAWEWAGRWMVEQGHDLTVVVEPLEPPELFDWFAGLRESLGMKIVALGPDAGGAVIRALRANGVVCLLCDRDLQQSGVDVEFFGERTTLPAGPVTIAMRTGAALLPTGVYFGGPLGRYAIVRPPLSLARRDGVRADVERITQELALELEALIRRAPEQWHLFQPNWPSDPGYQGRHR
jgi:KDO2-lipid IV(A) lauroyltransferase